MFNNKKSGLGPISNQYRKSHIIYIDLFGSYGVVRSRRRPVMGWNLEQLEGRELLSITQLPGLPDVPRLALSNLQAESAPVKGMGRGNQQFMSLGTPRTVRGEIVALPIKAISLTFDPITISLPGIGPVSTGPITASLQSNRLSYALFDTKSRMVQTDQFLQFDFPLLQAIGSPPPTLEFREIGPVTIGFNPRTKQVVALGNLRGGGIFDPGSVFSSATMLVNDSTNIFASSNPPLPSAPTPPVAFPGFFQPFDPGSVPDPRPLPNGFRPATVRQVRDFLAKQVMVKSAFSISGFFRAPGQAGDIPFGSMGHLGPVTSSARSITAPRGIRLINA